MAWQGAWGRGWGRGGEGGGCGRAGSEGVETEFCFLLWPLTLTTRRPFCPNWNYKQVSGFLIFHDPSLFNQILPGVCSLIPILVLQTSNKTTWFVIVSNHTRRERERERESVHAYAQKEKRERERERERKREREREGGGGGGKHTPTNTSQQYACASANCTQIYWVGKTDHCFKLRVLAPIWP